ncbi:hypothetical protein BKA66DRAFT_432790 [Pyrenochaeta sp. MPI-SDFR-AT-0127]|nr:hypothetical protein BKA66DRAFT_432790 [Pyrenochaeta sp. MPI-SDFR-AT-0127]
MATSEKIDLARNVNENNSKGVNVYNYPETPDDHKPLSPGTAPTQTSQVLSHGVRITIFLALLFLALLYFQYRFWVPLCMFNCRPLFGTRKQYNSAEPITMCPQQASRHERDAKCWKIYPNGRVEYLYYPWLPTTYDDEEYRVMLLISVCLLYSV